MSKREEALTRQARKAKQDQRKLRKKILEQKLRNSVSAMDPEGQQEAIETIIKKDKISQNHWII